MSLILNESLPQQVDFNRYHFSADLGRSYSTLGIGIAGFIAAAILVGAFLYRRFIVV